MKAAPVRSIFIPVVALATLPLALSTSHAGEKLRDYYCAAPKPSQQKWLRTWMKPIPDQVHLADLSIPGTHDTCALYGTAFAECQSWSVHDQLVAGIRFLDIRCRRHGTVFTIHHGIVFQKIKFDDVLQQCVKFLKAHPSECILMNVQEAAVAPKAGSQTFQAIFNKYKNRTNGFWFTADKIPTMGKARGKIILLTNEKGIGGTAWRRFTVQNDWKVPTASAIAAKSKKVIDNLTKAASNPGKPFLTFASGAGVLAPPFIVAKQVNLKVYQHITKPKKLGIVVMDFPGEKLIEAIAKTNSRLIKK